LNDPTGSTRFVCIPLTDKKLPFQRVANNRDSIWRRAYLEYKKGYQCYSTDQEMEEILCRNRDFEQVDPWYEELRRYVEKYDSRDFFYTEELFNAIGLVETYQINNSASVRLRNVMRQLGWEYKRRMMKGDQIRGYWRLPTSPT
jgi:predicted P-loop ATPase